MSTIDKLVCLRCYLDGIIDTLKSESDRRADRLSRLNKQAAELEERFEKYYTPLNEAFQAGDVLEVQRLRDEIAALNPKT